MTRDKARRLLDDYLHARELYRQQLAPGNENRLRKARAAVLDAMTADQERPVTETEPQENHVVLVPWPDHDMPWRAAFRLRGRWWYYDSNMAASPAPTVYRPMPPALKESKP